MNVAGAVGFWSYSHDDDERDGHGLLRLAARIQDEYALVTGETLTLFVDRDDISWGDEWRRRIETALTETTFFIPVITPLYFKRSECRRELLSFVGQAQSLGAMELVMPILYVDVPGLTEESVDEVLALVAKMQYLDWRELRLSAEDSAAYRRAVNTLAVRLAGISSKYEQSNQQAADSVGDVEEEGILDLLEIVERKLPEWQEFIDNGQTIVKQCDAITESYIDRFKKADSYGTVGPLLIVLRSFAREVEPPTRRLLQYTKDFSTDCIDLDPLILKVLRTLDSYPEVSQRVFNTLTPINDAAKTIEQVRKEDDRLASTKAIVNKYKGISKDLARMVRLQSVTDRFIDDANALVWNWHQEIQRYKGRGGQPQEEAAD